MLLPTVLFACHGSDSDTEAGLPIYPIDDVMRLNQIQVHGTHNSYHVATDGVTDPAFAYTHPPLDDQLESMGVRQIELDIDRDSTTGEFNVRHVPLIDEQANCDGLADCLGRMRTWHDHHPRHAPVLVLLEVKETYIEANATDWFAKLEDTVRTSWGEELTITPDSVQGDATTLRDAVATGWPTLGETRGKALFLLFGDDRWTGAYSQEGASLAGRLLFAQLPDDAAAAAVETIDDPVTDGARIATAIAAGRIVRARADMEDTPSEDGVRPAAALASGAQYISSDWVEARAESDYRFAIPGGTPGRCNPVNAPEGCRAEDVEDPRAYNSGD